MILLLNLLALNCASTGSNTHESLEYGSGVKYIQKQRKLDFSIARKAENGQEKSPSLIALYFDILLAPINIFYFPLKQKTYFANVDLDGNVVTEANYEQYEREMLAIEQEILTDEVRAGQTQGEREQVGGFQAFFDYLLLPLNLFYYPATDKTILKSIDNTTVKGYDEIERNRMEGSVKEKRARTYLRKLGIVQKHNPSIFELEQYVEVFTLLPADQIASSKLYYSADRIMEHTTPEEFEDALEDANWDAEDLELSESEIQELKENGYLVSNDAPNPVVKK